MGLSEIAEHSGAIVPQQSAMMNAEQSRAIQEVQAAFVIAKQFPRDEVAAERRIIEACKRPGLANAGEYAYPRGGQQITGPSIRLAEVLARYWGNLNYGIRELSQSSGASEMEAFCHDLETNVKVVRIFRSQHIRYTRSGTKSLEDPRDIYENNANLGSRRLRAAILEIIPGDVVESAVKQCHKTLSGQSDKPIIDRIKAMTAAFEKIGVSSDQISKRMGKRVDALLEIDLVNLLKIYNSLSDGMSKPTDWFAEDNTDLKGRLVDLGGGDEETPKPPEKTEEPRPDRAERLKRPARQGNWQATITTLDEKHGPDIDDVYIAALDEMGCVRLDKVPSEKRKEFAALVEKGMGA